MFQVGGTGYGDLAAGAGRAPIGGSHRGCSGTREACRAAGSRHPCSQLQHPGRHDRGGGAWALPGGVMSDLFRSPTPAPRPCSGLCPSPALRGCARLSGSRLTQNRPGWDSARGRRRASGPGEQRRHQDGGRGGRRGGGGAGRRVRVRVTHTGPLWDSAFAFITSHFERFNS